jgi:rhamnosyltransferase
MRWLDAQLNSILSQSFEGQVDVLIRDDGSQDGTLDFLSWHASERVKVVHGKNLGAKGSFLELMRMAQGIPADFYALADQDDIWLPNKLSQATRHIDTMEPALYCSALQLVDEKLDPLSVYRHPGDRSFASTLLCNFATGCTCVFNRALLEAFRFPENHSHLLMHDWWLASTASAQGRVFYDEQPYILYRQHASNQVGIKQGLRGLIRRFKVLLGSKQGPSRLTQAHALKAAYQGNFPAPALATLTEFLSTSDSFVGRITFAWAQKSHVNAVTALRYVLRA